MRSIARHVLAAATAGASLTAPAHGADSCYALTGSAVLPAMALHYTPGLGAAPRMQSVRIDDRAAPVAAPGALVLDCAFAPVFPNYGTTAYAGALSFGPATGTSFLTEDVVSGAGTVSGLFVTGTGGEAGAYQVAPGFWHVLPYPAATLSASGSLSYVRAGTVVAVVVALGSVRIDPDGSGGGTSRLYGDVTLAGAALVQGASDVTRPDVRHVSTLPGQAVATRVV